MNDELKRGYKHYRKCPYFSMTVTAGVQEVLRSCRSHVGSPYSGMTVTARVHNHSITLPSDVSIADGTLVEIHTLEEMPIMQRAGAWMLKYAGVADDLPTDAAAQHDHYLYGTPKR